MSKTKKFWTEGPGSFGLAILFALTIRWGFMEAYVIPSGSMLPSLLIYDHIFVNKSVYGIRIPFSEKWLVKFGSPKKGEVIVFKFPQDMGTFYIKRVVGTPGDKVYYENGKLFVNDTWQKQYNPVGEGTLAGLDDADIRSKQSPDEKKTDYYHHVEDLAGTAHDILLKKIKSRMDTFGPIEVPEGKLFVMGDNRDQSNDSRFWGFVPEDYILGRAMFVWLSCDDTLPIITFICNPLKVRWDRFFHPIHSKVEMGTALTEMESPQGIQVPEADKIDTGVSESPATETK